MSNNKQSSLEWLISQLIEKDLLMIYGKSLEDNDLIEIIKQAKAMRKEEIINAVQSCGYIGGATDEEAEQYYNETYGGNK
jgi:predicted CopG family antitoxin